MDDFVLLAPASNIPTALKLPTLYCPTIQLAQGSTPLTLIIIFQDLDLFALDKLEFLFASGFAFAFTFALMMAVCPLYHYLCFVCLCMSLYHSAIT